MLENKLLKERFSKRPHKITETMTVIIGIIVRKTNFFQLPIDYI